jgi:hypothetical protein
VISIASFLSFGNVAIVGLLGIYALLWLVAAKPRPGWRWLLLGGLAFALGAATLWLYLWLRHGLSFYAVWNEAMGKHFEMDRIGWFWIGYHLYDFYVAAAGIPILVFWAAQTIVALRDAWVRRVPVNVLAIALLVGLLLLDLSGAARGEVARVWAFLLPLPLLVAVNGLPRRRSIFLGLMALLVLQLFVANVYVRYVGTDLIDPPDPPPAAVAAAGDTPWDAVWEGRIRLESVQVPAKAAPGEPVTVHAVWTAERRINRPYTVFIHLYDSQGNLVTQRDTMTLEGRWPTTCWRPGETFRDSYTLTLPGTPVSGTYRVALGMYWLPTGERVPVTGRGATDARVVEIGALEVGRTDG